MKYKYDVFISYSRRDYVDESYNVIPGNAIAEIQNVFDENEYLRFSYCACDNFNELLSTVNSVFIEPMKYNIT